MDAATPVPDGTATHEDDSAVETTDGVTDEQQPPSRKRHGARNQHKVKHFLRWLVKTFPTALERVRQSVIQEEEENTDNNNKEESQPRQQQNADKEEEGFSTAGAAATDADDDDGDDDDDSFFFTRPLVLDVAGGKGELAARLCFTEPRQRVVLVDPRPADVVSCYENTVVRRLPDKWQRRLRARRAADPRLLHRLARSRFRQLTLYFKDDDDDDTDTNKTATTTRETHRDDDDDDDARRLRDAVRNAALLIGLHADGATEAIVDVALRTNTPFVVVPCCVFPNFFPTRRLVVASDANDDNNGGTTTTTTRPVRSHEDFCAYLLQKDARLQRSVLPFEGRNVAIWWDGT